ncbi:MAG: NADH-quinone oxidoreductase subunit B family protein [Terriglobales bacterium]
MTSETKPRLAVVKLASCDGCQLQMLNLEDELLDIVGAVEVAYFLEARSKIVEGPYDVALVEGSVTTSHDAERLRELRRNSQTLITIGACASAGGIQALRNLQDVDEYTRAIYANPSYIHTLSQSTPVAAHVAVDFAINGCPISKDQLLEVVTALLIGRVPQLPTYSVCVECKRAANVCVLVSRGVACIGPITQAGCGALCPSFNRGCFGCYGPMESANPDSLCQGLIARGVPRAEMIRLLNGFTGWAEEFRSAAEKLEKAFP